METVLQSKKTEFSSARKMIATGTLISLLCNILYSCHGIDMTDTCLQLYLQKNAFSGIGDTWMTVPLTNYTGGAWLSLFPNIGKMYWAHLGGAFLSGVTSLFSLKIYCLFFGKIEKKDWLITLCSVVFLARKSLIDYYSFPVMILVVFLWLILKIMKEGLPFSRQWIVLGIIGGIIFFSRFSFMPILLIPFGILLYRRIEEKQSFLYSLSRYIIGLLISALPLCILYIMWKNQFIISRSELTLSNLLYRAKAFPFLIFPILRAFSIASGMAIVVRFLELSMSFKRQHRYGFMAFAGSVLISAMLLIYYSIIGKYGGFFGVLPNRLMLLYILPAMLFATLLITLWKSDSHIDQKSEKPYLLSLIISSLLIPFGSDVGYCKLTYLAPVFIPLLGGLIFHRNNGRHVFRRYAFFSIIISGIIVNPLYAYLDAPVLSCGSSPSCPELKYMRTTKERANMWDKLLFTIKQNTEGEKEILMVGYLNFGPLFLLDLYDWNHGVCTGGKDFMKRYHHNIDKKPLPRLVFADEKSSEFMQFRLVLYDNYIKILTIDEHKYSVWRKK